MSRRLVVVLSVFASIVLIGVVAAWAYFTTTGSGSGSTGTATTVPVTLSSATATAGLYPGATTSVAVNVSNPNASPIRVSTLALDTSQGTGGFAVDGAHSGCALSVLSFTTQTNAGNGWTIPASSNPTITLNNALAMSTAAANACQGAAFTIYLTAGT